MAWIDFPLTLDSGTGARRAHLTELREALIERGASPAALPAAHSGVSWTYVSNLKTLAGNLAASFGKYSTTSTTRSWTQYTTGATAGSNKNIFEEVFGAGNTAWPDRGGGSLKGINSETLNDIYRVLDTYRFAKRAGTAAASSSSSSRFKSRTKSPAARGDAEAEANAIDGASWGSTNNGLSAMYHCWQEFSPGGTGQMYTAMGRTPAGLTVSPLYPIKKAVYRFGFGVLLVSWPTPYSRRAHTFNGRIGVGSFPSSYSSATTFGSSFDTTTVSGGTTVSATDYKVLTPTISATAGQTVTVLWYTDNLTHHGSNLWDVIQNSDPVDNLASEQANLEYNTDAYSNDVFMDCDFDKMTTT